MLKPISLKRFKAIKTKTEIPREYDVGLLISEIAANPSDYVMIYRHGGSQYLSETVYSVMIDVDLNDVTFYWKGSPKKGASYDIDAFRINFRIGRWVFYKLNLVEEQTPKKSSISSQWIDVKDCPEGDIWVALDCGHVVQGSKYSKFLEWSTDERNVCCEDAKAIKVMPNIQPTHPNSINAQPERHLTVTTNSNGDAVLVSWQDEEHRILEIVWER